MAAAGEDIAELIIFLIIGFLFLMRWVVRHVLSGSQEKGRQRGRSERKSSVYEASAESIREFLQKAQQSARERAERPSGRERTPEPARHRGPALFAGPEETEKRNKWVVRKGDKKYGPYPAERINRLIRAGRIEPGTMLYSQATARWMPVQRINQFSDALREARDTKVREAKKEPPPRAAPPAPTRPKKKVRLPVLGRLTGPRLSRGVIWSEVIGLPVAMRRHVGHRPPTMGAPRRRRPQHENDSA